MNQNPGIFIAKLTSLITWFGFILSIIAFLNLDQMSFTNSFLQYNSLSAVLSILVLFISSIVQSFSINYLHGDSNYRQFFLNVFLLTLSVLTMLLANSVWLLVLFWTLSNLLLVNLMVHKETWREARNSGLLALKTLMFSSLTLALAMYLLSNKVGSIQISEILTYQFQVNDWILISSLCFIVLAAMAQSAQIPFSKWLLSSLNSPTPVSAFMHAGLVNGGGFLIAKFSPLFSLGTKLLLVVLFVGTFSAIAGTAAMMIRTSIKNSLAASTVGQMGFMFVQLGMGLMPAAISHLCMHGCFKAFLFLNSGSTLVRTSKKDKANSGTVTSFLIALSIGFAATFVFIYSCGLEIDFASTKIFQIAFVYLALVQLSYELLKKQLSLFLVSITLMIASISALFYGFLLHNLELLFIDLNILTEIKASWIHYLVFCVFALIWFFANLKESYSKIHSLSLLKRIYVKILNFSEPGSGTSTSRRTNYSF